MQTIQVKKTKRAYKKKNNNTTSTKATKKATPPKPTLEELSINLTIDTKEEISKATKEFNEAVDKTVFFVEQHEQIKANFKKYLVSIDLSNYDGKVNKSTLGKPKYINDNILATARRLSKPILYKWRKLKNDKEKNTAKKIKLVASFAVQKDAQVVQNIEVSIRTRFAELAYDTITLICHFGGFASLLQFRQVTKPLELFIRPQLLPAFQREFNVEIRYNPKMYIEAKEKQNSVQARNLGKLVLALTKRYCKTEDLNKSMSILAKGDNTTKDLELRIGDMMEKMCQLHGETLVAFSKLQKIDYMVQYPSSIADNKKLNKHNSKATETICHVVKLLESIPINNENAFIKKIIDDISFHGPNENFFCWCFDYPSPNEIIQLECATKLMAVTGVYHPEIIPNGIMLLGGNHIYKIAQCKTMVVHEEQYNIKLMTKFSQLVFADEARKFGPILDWIKEECPRYGDNEHPIAIEEDVVMMDETKEIVETPELKLPTIQVKTEACVQFMKEKYPEFIVILRDQ